MLQEAIQWVLAIVPLAALIYLGGKWALKKGFPSLMPLLYFLVPTYLISVVLTVSVGPEELNAYCSLDLSAAVFLLSPPLVWDALFGMGVAEARLDLAFLSVFFIAFLPAWLALKTTVGVPGTEDGDLDWRVAGYRLLGGWVVVIIMGLGMPNFFAGIFTLLTSFEILGINGIFWVCLGALAAFCALAFWRLKSRGEKNGEEKVCEIIDGREVCRYE
jgi:hypothetical protein